MSNAKQKTLIIMDWDDTLFPTSWLVNNNINIAEPNTFYKHKSYFEILDKYLHDVLEQAKCLGKVIIITNAMPEWIKMATAPLPKTTTCLTAIAVVSARELYQGKHDMMNWKKMAFKNENANYENILSLGDAEYEYMALVDLWKDNPHKYLKSIKFVKTPNNFVLLEQLRIIKKKIFYLCKIPKHLDLKFRIAG